MLRGISDSEMGMLIAGATILRTRLTKEGVLLAESLDLSIPRLDGQYDYVPLELSKLIKIFQKDNRPTDAAFTMVWLHSTRALNALEIRVFGREMWAELTRGFPYISLGFQQISELLGTDMRRKQFLDAEFIPIGLEPNT